jgi:hypothetical protein
MMPCLEKAAGLTEHVKLVKTLRAMTSMRCNGPARSASCLPLPLHFACDFDTER